MKSNLITIRIKPEFKIYSLFCQRHIFLIKERERAKQKQAGSVADYFGTHQHYEIPVNFDDFGRRFVLSYPYFEVNTESSFITKIKCSITNKSIF